MSLVLHPDAAGLKRALAALAGHAPVVMPTETVYGLAAGTLDPAGLARIFELKGRPADNPLIAHVASTAMARALVDDWDDRAQALAAAFWPGPLTIILPRAADVPPIAAGGRDTLAVRQPAHPVAAALIEAAGPLSAPSANRSGRVSPTTAGHVAADYLHVAEASELLILDGGACEVGLESTVVSLADGPAKLLRPGSVQLAQLEAVVGPLNHEVPWTQNEAPGSSPRHYAPATAVALIEDEAWSGQDTTDAACIELPSDACAAQAVLYDLLRKADALGRARILVRMPPDTPRWRAVRDRLLRAAHRDA